MPRSLFENPTLSRPRRALRWAVNAYAWVVIVGTLVILAGLLAVRAGDMDASSSIMGWSTPDGTHHAGWLLRYDGAAGYALAAALFVGVLVAAIGSTMRAAALRQASLLALLAWSGVWLAGALRQCVATGGDSTGVAVACAAGVVCSYMRARRRWVIDDEGRVPHRGPLTA